MHAARHLALLVLLSCVIQCDLHPVRPQETPQAAAEGKGPLLVPYSFQSETVTTTIDTGEEQAQLQVFENSGILQYNHLKQVALFRLETESLVAGTQTEELLQGTESLVKLDQQGVGAELSGGAHEETLERGTRESRVEKVEADAQRETTASTDASERSRPVGRMISQEDAAELLRSRVAYWASRSATLAELLQVDRVVKYLLVEDRDQYRARLERETKREPLVVELKKSGPESVRPGAPIDYTFLLNNITDSADSSVGRTEINNIFIRDDLDQGLVYDGEYHGRITADGETLREFRWDDADVESKGPEISTSNEWSKGILVWNIPGTIHPGEALEFTFRVAYYLEHGLVVEETPLLSEPDGGEEIAVLSPEAAALRVIERNRETGWLEVAVRIRDRNLRGFIEGPRFVTVESDDVDREKRFQEIYYASKRQVERDKGLVR